ncbi:hypothetical protein ASE04_22825 [Rhizobium sp. Root708]|uniref:O-antigen ligase family protein n=1 Tax=Rhizobium sp. Root708 TaxID=1736592 RepID=UPI0006F225CA|nr:O-antigen ligase family protein [Rhizobium sp. Root708]KRB61198.1 hypothetical protein ASE04_22825 [Rhizobium sp. Root708]
MPDYLRALIYTLIVTLPALFVAGRVAVPTIDAREFRVWSVCWVATMVAAFLAPSFMVFSLLLVPICIYGNISAKQPLYLFVVLMFAAPCCSVLFGIPGLMHSIVYLDPPRLLVILVLLPVALSLLGDRDNRRLSLMDLLLVGYVVLTALLATRLVGMNDLLRQLASNVLTMVIPYFVFSRAIRSKEDVNRLLLAFVVASMPLATLGVFEVLKGWRVYVTILDRWEIPMLTAYLFRDGMLRASTSAIESIAFGFLCMTGTACLFLLNTGRSDIWRKVAIGIMLCGLLSSLSRGPWLGFALFLAILFGANLKASFKYVALGAAAIMVVLLSSPSLMGRFVNLLPFVGSADRGSESYRSELFERSLMVIQRNPLFGSVNFMKAHELQAMIQGQGIIDIVNTYLQISLEFGLIALALFVAFFGLVTAKLAIMSLRTSAPEANHLGVAALLLAILFTIATTSSVTVIPYIYWTVAGLAVALIRKAPVVVPPPRMRVVGARF